MKSLLSIGLACLLMANHLFAQESMPGLRVYSTHDGYPAQKGYLINQDSLGFIWIGSDQGAIRFDGSTFELIDDEYGFTVREILEAKPFNNRRVVIMPVLNNWACFQGDSLVSPDILNLNGIKNELVNVIMKDGNRLWVADGLNKGFIYKLEKESNKLEKVPIALSRKFRLIKALGDSLLLHEDYYRSSNLFFYNIIDNQSDTLKSDEGDGLWSEIEYNDKHGLFITYSTVHGKMQLLKLSGNKLHLLYEYQIEGQLKQIRLDRKNQIWLTFAGEGLQFWGKIDELTASSTPIALFPNTIINDVFLDRDNNLWMSTEASGLFFISEAHWESYLFAEKIKIHDFQIQAMAPHSHFGLLCSVDSGRVGVVLNNTFQLYPKREKNQVRVKSLFPFDSLCFASTSEGLVKIEFTDTNYTLEKLLPNEITTKGLVLSEEQETLFVANHMGLYAYSVSNPGNEISLFEGRTTSVERLDSRGILLGTPNGLHICDPISKKAKLVEHSILSKAHITCMAKFDDSNYLIGTSSAGLFVYRKDEDSFESLATGSIPDNPFIRKIKLAKGSEFWVATNAGCLRVLTDNTFNKLNVNHFNYETGLFSDDIKDISIVGDDVFVLSSKGLNVIKDKRSNYQDEPKALVYRIKSNNRSYYIPKELNLKHGENDVEILLKTFCFDCGEPPRVFYQLEGYHNRWFESSSLKINLHLPAGEHRLLLKTVNTQNVESLSILPINVEKAFWQMVWFQLAAAGLVVLLIILIIQRVLRLRQKAEIKSLENENHLAKLELEAIKAHINPHFIFNCLNSIQYLSRSGKKEKATQYISVFSSILRKTMKLSQLTFITIEEELNYLSQYLELEKMRFKDKLNYSIEMLEGVSAKALIPAMMVQPFVENAIKHGIVPFNETGAIRIGITEKNERIKIIVEDSGKGWLKQDIGKGEGIGVRLAVGRVKSYNQLFNTQIEIQIRNKGQENRGTIVELIIPKNEQNSTHSR